MARTPGRRAGRRTGDVADALRRQLDRALSELRRTPALRDASVHEARKELKRARATLRLLRDGIGNAAYRRANRRLRDAARPLSRLRDARVLLDAVAELRAEAKPSARADLDSLARDLRRDREQLRARLVDGSHGLRRVRQAIESVRRESRGWPAPAARSLRRGVARIYREGRKSLARAEAEPGDEALHESRKQTKYLGKALEVLEPRGLRGEAKRAKRAEAIADALGEDHDLAVLCQLLAKRPERSPARRALLSRIERRRGALQRKALKRSRRLYDRKPGSFRAALDLAGAGAG